jgi:hypothetical protein
MIGELPRTLPQRALLPSGVGMFVAGPKFYGCMISRVLPWGP